MEIRNSSGSVKINIAEPNLCIPQEILEEILSRLPVESLLRFRCVSILWLSVIDSQRFIKIHLKKSTENPCFSHHRIILNPVRSHHNHNRLLMMCYWRSLLQEPIVEPFEVDDQKRIDREVNLVGCCNGLVCLLQGEKFILWNPSTRMSMDLPEVDVRQVGIMNIGCRKFRMYGFGYDESSDDYKVFTIFTLDTKTIGRVYSHNSHSWKTVEGNVSLYGREKAGKFISGNLHWLGNNGKDHGIVSFNLRNDSYGMVEQMSWLDYTFLDTLTLGVIEGCLSMLFDYNNSHLDVWVMKQYGLKESWVNVFSISNFNHPPLRTQRIHSFCRGPNEEFLLIYSSTMMIYRYYPEDYEFLCSRIIIIDKLMEEGAYVESLVTLGPYAEEEDSF